jgi:branched-chain amino acid transport system substrate-binding protein
MALDYIERFKAQNGAEPPIFGALVVDAVQLINVAAPAALAQAQPGTVEFRAALRDSLEQTKDVYLNVGLLSNSPINHSGFDPKGMFMTVIKDEQFRLLEE